MPCKRCESIPIFDHHVQDYYITLPTDHHVEGFEKSLAKKGLMFEKMEEGYFIEKLEGDEFISYLATSVFNSVEKKDVRILKISHGKSLSFCDLKNYRSLEEWERLEANEEVLSIIQEKRIRTLFQPIIEVETGEIYGYEALSRGIQSDGLLMHPGKLFSEAKAMDLLFNLDKVCREASIRAAAKLNLTKKLFINFIPTAIYEPSLCLQSTAKTLSEVGLSPAQVVFEVVESERVDDFLHLNRILDYYRSRGYSTALDDIGSGYSNIETLLNLKPNYIKIDMDVIRNIHEDLKNQKVLDEFVVNARRIGAKILAEGIECHEEYEYLKSVGVDLCQGYYFGKPQEDLLENIVLTNL